MSNTPRPLALFISYSHKDDDLRAKLDAHLSTLKRQNVFDVWHDRRISAGREWAGEINDALERADVVLLLVSSDFLASDYCYDKEMMRALQRHDQRSARVVPVILRPCDWHSSQFGKLQALPRDGQPIVSYSNADSALTEVAVALRALADDIRGRGATPVASTASEITPAPTIRAQHFAERLSPDRAENANRSDGMRSATASEGPIGQREPAETQKLKIGAIKLWFLEIGPFELGWPPKIGASRLIALMLAGAATVVIATYWFTLKPRLDEARDLMRRAEYVDAENAIELAPRWSKALPFVAGITAQARFGSRLAGGDHIRNLAPELQLLHTRYPNAPDVLVFQGLKSYYVDNNPEQALKQFTDAANRDKAHVEAHFLAAGRHVDIAYAALGHRDEAQARLAASEARRLIERVVSQSPFAETLPRYANQIAELHELYDNAPGAYASYARLAPLHSLSALQAAFVSWRLQAADTALKHSLEAIEAAIERVEKGPTEASETEGWLFRISATDLIDVRSEPEKLCLLAWAIEISRSLQSTLDSGIPTENTTSSASSQVAAFEPCGKGGVAARTQEIVCVQVLTARRAISTVDARQQVLERWTAARLKCEQDLQPLPGLSVVGLQVSDLYVPKERRIPESNLKA